MTYQRLIIFTSLKGIVSTNLSTSWLKNTDVVYTYDKLIYRLFLPILFRMFEIPSHVKMFVVGWYLYRA